MAPGILMGWPMKLQRNEKAPHRHSLALKLDKKAPNGHTVNELFSLRIRIESAPLVAFGPPENSSGALLSGVIDLCARSPTNARDKTFQIAKFEMKLVMEVTTRRPIEYNCPACTSQQKVLHTWVFIPSAWTLAYNDGAPHGFPFSFLLPGDWPATTESVLASVSYRLIPEAVPVEPVCAEMTTSGPCRPPSPKRAHTYKSVALTQPLKLYRSILPADVPRNSHRFFPPTSIYATLALPTVIYPGALDHAVELTLAGLIIAENKLRWSLHKISWRIYEYSKVVSPACTQHLGKAGCVDGNGILFEDSRVVGAYQLKNGWKHCCNDDCYCSRNARIRRCLYI